MTNRNFSYNGGLTQDQRSERIAATPVNSTTEDPCSSCGGYGVKWLGRNWKCMLCSAHGHIKETVFGDPKVEPFADPDVVATAVKLSSDKMTATCELRFEPNRKLGSVWITVGDGSQSNNDVFRPQCLNTAVRTVEGAFSVVEREGWTIDRKTVTRLEERVAGTTFAKITFRFKAIEP
jgi:hypothetical protein